MRSSDIWLGLPYDMFNFSMITGYIGLILRQKMCREVSMGWVTINVGSSHLYLPRDTAEASHSDYTGPSFNLEQFYAGDDLLFSLDAYRNVEGGARTMLEKRNADAHRDG
jgi:thymidylate synthase